MAVTNYCCVGESLLGHSVVVFDCNVLSDDVISATFYILSIEFNEYNDGVKEKLAGIIP